MGLLASVVLYWTAAFSLAALGAVALDKARARRGGRRLRERTLLLLALVGGSPGLVIGLWVFRHKTQKPAFLGRLLLVVVLQALALAWFLYWRGGGS